MNNYQPQDIPSFLKMTKWLMIKAMPKKFLKELRILCQEIRAEVQSSDWQSGIADFILASTLLIAFIGQLFGASFGSFLADYFQHWYAWEVLALVTTPSLIWIFEKRGPEDPRLIDVPRPVRVGFWRYVLLLLCLCRKYRLVCAPCTRPRPS